MQHTECLSAIQVVRGREQKRKRAGSTHMQEEQQAHHFFRRRLVGVAGGRVRGGVSRGSGLKYRPQDGHFSQFERLQWSTQSGPPSGRWKRPPHKQHLSTSCTASYCHNNHICTSQHWHLHVEPLAPFP